MPELVTPAVVEYDEPLMLWVNLPLVNIFHTEKAKNVMVHVKIKATSESKLGGRIGFM